MARALFLPSHVGLGHVARDVVIAGLLRGLEPRVSIEWCTAEPALGFLEKLGERVAPGCAGLESFSQPIEDLYNGRVRGLRDLASSLSILKRNYEVISGLLEGYDLVFADEFWEVVYSVPDEVRRGIVFATDIVYKPYTLRPLDSLLSLVLNRYFKRVLARYRELIYLNDPDMLGRARSYRLVGGRVAGWLERNAYTAGLATSYPPGGLPSAGEARRRLGLSGDEALVVVTVGGTSASSREMLDCIDRASHAVAKAVREATGASPRILALPGPRTPWRPSSPLVEVPSDPAPAGLRDYYAAASLFIARSGRTTTADLLCAGIPGVLIPIPGHFEQEEIARHMNRRHGYPVLDQESCTPERLASAVRAALSKRPRPPRGLCLGASRAAARLAELLRAPTLRPPNGGGGVGGAGQ